MKTLVITGGTGGLGSVVTKALIAGGYNCVVPYRTESEAQSLRNSLDPDRRSQLLLLEANLLDDGAWPEVFGKAKDFGEFYGLVHLLGGIKSFDTVAESEVKDFDFLMNLNLRSYYLASREAMKLLAGGNGGRIVGISSMQGIRPGAKHGGYGVAKAGVVALTSILADEGREHGITANAIAPSIIDTPANREWGSEEDIKQWVTPQQIAEAIEHLLSDAGKAVNGSVIQAFGGVYF